MEFLQSTADELRQLQLLGQAITTALESILVEPLPHEIITLLGLLESKEEKKVKLMKPVSL